MTNFVIPDLTRNLKERMKEIEELRKEIDIIDEKLIDLLAKRMEVVREIGVVKKKLGLKIIDTHRKETVRKNWQEIGLNKGLDAEYLDELYKIVHQFSAKQQN